MGRNFFVRVFVTLASLCMVVVAVPALANATPLRPGTGPVAGSSGSSGSSSGSAGSSDLQITRSQGIGYHVKVKGDDIVYTATDVPNIYRVVLGRPVEAPGSCTTVAADAVKAITEFGPSILEIIAGGTENINILELLNTLIAHREVILGVHTVRFATDGVVSDMFEHAPSGLYIVLTVCNANQHLYGFSTAFVSSGNGSLGSAGSS